MIFYRWVLVVSLALSGVLLSDSVFAASEKEPSTSLGYHLKKIEWNRIRVAPLAVMQSSPSGHFYSTVVSWYPEYDLNEKWSLGFGLGYSMFKRVDKDRFSVFEYNFSVAYLIQDAWAIELLAGGQTWLAGSADTGPMLGLNGKYVYPKKIFGIINQAFFGFNKVYQNFNFYIIRLGVVTTF